MRFRLGPPENSLSDEDFHSGEWHQLRELPFWLFQLVALLAGALVSFAILILWLRFKPGLAPDPDTSWEVPVVVFAVLCAGTALQIAAHPGSGFTAKSVLGIWPRRFLPYTYFDGHISKGRYVFSLLLPAVALVGAPFLLASFRDGSSGWLAFISCIGALSFGAGPFLALSAAIQMPARARVAGRGMQVFWRRP